MSNYIKDLDKVIAGLKKASKTHAAQARALEKIKKDQSKSFAKKKAKKK